MFAIKIKEILKVCFFSKRYIFKSEIPESKGFCILNFRLLSKKVVRIPNHPAVDESVDFSTFLPAPFLSF